MIDRRILLAGAMSALPAAALAQSQPPKSDTTVSGVEVSGPKPQRDPNAPKPVPYSLDELYRSPLTLDVALAPDGGRIAALVRGEVDGKPVTGLRVTTTDAGGALVKQARFGPVDTRYVAWSSPGRVLVGVAEPRTLTVTRTFSKLADAVLELDYRRILSVSLEGGPSALVMSKLAEDVQHALDFQLVAPAAEDGDHALVAAFRATKDLKSFNDQGGLSGITHFPGTLTLFRADLRTGEHLPVEKGEDGTLWWMAQKGRPLLRCDVNARGDQETLFSRGPQGKTWKKVRSARPGSPDFRSLAPSDQAGKVWVIARGPGETRPALRLFDTADQSLGPAQLDRGDIAPVGALIDPAGGLVAAEYATAGKTDYVFADPTLGVHMGALRAFFDYDAAVRLVGADPGHKRFLVLVSGPQDPGGWYAYDRDARRIEPAAGRQPWLLPERLSKGDLVQVNIEGRATDGCLTGPLDGAPGPMVVQLQDATDPTDLFDYDRQAQALAARGWWSMRCIDPPPEALDALVAHTQAVAGLTGQPVAVMGGPYTSPGAYAHVRRKPGLYRAAVAMTPRDVPGLTAGFAYDGVEKVAATGKITTATGTSAPALLVYPYGDRISAFNRGMTMSDVLDKEGIGGLGAVQRLRTEGDHSWAEQASQQGRMAAVIGFLEKVFKG